jgi:hypothetical protein
LTGTRFVFGVGARLGDAGAFEAAGFAGAGARPGEGFGFGFGFGASVASFWT